MAIFEKQHFDVIVLGGGAAGMMCASVAGARGRRVALLEHNDRVGKKIQISGGGRCNFTNLYARPENYISAQPDFCKSALARYSPQDFLRLVESYAIPYHEKKLGQQFCDNHAREITEMLLQECRKGGVRIKTSCRVKAVRRNEKYVLETCQGEMSCDSLVVATGGLSFPKLGATDFGYGLARQFELAVTDLRPGLVPLLFAPNQKERWPTLSGISLPVKIKNRNHSFEESLLVTHRGLSGPAVLQISSFWNQGEILEIDLMPGIQGPEWLRKQSGQGGTLEQVLAGLWPQRFAKVWAEEMGALRPLAQLSGEAIQAIGKELNAWKISCAGTEGYAKAEVTLGGISTTELSSKTMEARRVPGLYFIGEVVDVTGWLGGYNFQWAWASAQAAGQVV